jgi:hypothetical protein
MVSNSSALDRETLQAFAGTDYVVDPGGHDLVLRVGRCHAALDRLLGNRPWAIVTACNPLTQRLSEAENRDRNRRLGAELDAGDFDHWPACNRDPGGRWPDEPGFLVAGIDPAQARALGARHGQAAVLAAAPGEPAALEFCPADGSRPGAAPAPDR